MSVQNVCYNSILLPDDCCLHETLSCNKGFELTHFLYGLHQIYLICGTLSTFAVEKLTVHEHMIYKYNLSFKRDRKSRQLFFPCCQFYSVSYYEPDALSLLIYPVSANFSHQHPSQRPTDGSCSHTCRIAVRILPLRLLV